MNLHGFFQIEADRVRRFDSYWREQNAQSPVDFPMEMQPGEWDEQYTAYRSMEMGE